VTILYLAHFVFLVALAGAVWWLIFLARAHDRQS
jgi:hypothetical protein